MENLIKARSTIVFIAALLTAVALAAWIERESQASLAAAGPKVTTGAAGASLAPVLVPSRDLAPVPAPRALTSEEAEWAKVAWSYFAANTDPGTGLARSVEGFGATTLWDSASFLLALVSAERLGVIGRREFDERLARALGSLSRMPLYADALPNKSYRTTDLAMTDYGGNPAPQGIGWSAIDIGRMLVPLHLVAWRYPQHTPSVRAVIARWDLARLTQDGSLMGMVVEAGAPPVLLQEGRLGYEQYAAKSFALAGVDVHRALNYFGHLAHADIDGIQVGYDSRDPARYGGQNFVVSEPYMLDGLEFGWDSVSRELSWRVYRAQEERARRTGVLTAASEDHIDRPPYFVYNTIFSAGRAWNTITERGEDASPHRALSTKTAFALHALYRTPYTEKLIAAVRDLHDARKGWFAGRYEEGGTPNRALTANTNAIVLQSLAYIAGGRLMSFRTREP